MNSYCYAESLITKYDGKTEQIKNINVGDIVLGSDNNGNVIETVVTQISKGNISSDWHQINGIRKKRGSGASSFRMKASPNLLIFIKDKGWVPFSNVNKGDRCFSLHYDISLTNVQKSILLGIILGDGYLLKKDHGSAKIEFSHSSKQKDYLDWTINSLGSLAYHGFTAKSGYGSTIYRASTRYSFDIYNTFVNFNKPSGEIPEEVIQMMNPISLAYWYMDDGSLSSYSDQEDRANFSTNSFNYGSQLILQESLRSQGIDSVLQTDNRHDDQYFIRLNADSSDMLFSIICPYIPPSMQYKLPVYYRGNIGWIPPRIGEYRNFLGDVEVSESSMIEDILKIKSRREWFIDTECHSFFISNILCKNNI